MITKTNANLHTRRLPPRCITIAAAGPVSTLVTLICLWSALLISFPQPTSARTDSSSQPGESSPADDEFDSLTFSDDPPGYPAIATPNRDLVMAFTIRGIVAEVLVEEAQEVNAGDALVRLKSDMQYWTVESHRIAAEDETDLIAARKQLELADFDLTRLEDADRRSGVSQRELVHARANLILAENDVQAAEFELESARAAYNREKARLDDMTIYSDIRGTIAKITVEPGESVDELQPVIQLVSIDPLWLDVAVPVETGMTIEAGDAVTVHWRDVQREKPSSGRVKFVLPVVDSASNSRVVRVEVPNADRLPAGLHAFVEFRALRLAPDAIEAGADERTPTPAGTVESNAELANSRLE